MSCHRPADAAGRIHQAVEGQHAWRAPGTRNGLAACPAHVVAFDTGLLAVNGWLRIRVARSLARAAVSDPLARQYYGRLPLREALRLPAELRVPARKYLDRRRKKIFIA